MPIKQMRMKPYPTFHIYGSTGARAAVLAKYPNAKASRTETMGKKWPMYVIRAAGREIGYGHGTTDAWEQTAIALYS